MIKQSIRIEDHGLIHRLKNGPETVHREAHSFMEIVLAYILRRVKIFTPVGVTGLLRGSLFTGITGTGANLRGKVATNSIYGEPVEMGTVPHWAPIRPLKLWALRKLGDESAAYAVRGKIKREGTEGVFMFKRAFEQSRSFVDQQAQALAERIARIIDGG
jgi:hypothetical protein